MTTDTRDRAVDRLNAALAEQDRLSDAYGAAVGTSREFSAYVRLGAAGEQVAARQAWLESIDDDGVGSRIWVNGREVGGPDSLFQGLEDSHD
jgi:hypothetical protein